VVAFGVIMWGDLGVEGEFTLRRNFGMLYYYGFNRALILFTVKTSEYFIDLTE